MGELRAIDGYIGGLVVRTALKLAPLLLARPGRAKASRMEANRPLERFFQRLRTPSGFTKHDDH
jgi:hypothetical protein